MTINFQNCFENTILNISENLKTIYKFHLIIKALQTTQIFPSLISIRITIIQSRIISQHPQNTITFLHPLEPLLLVITFIAKTIKAANIY